MPKQTYALEPDGQRRIEVSWKGIWKNISVSLDGQILGVIPDQKALAAGQEFPLADGSSIKVQLVGKLYSTELRVLRNGQPLPGSASDPLTRVKTAYGLIYFVAGLNFLLGILALAGVEFFQQLGFGVISLIAGVIFLMLGFFTQHLSSIALIMVIVLLALDGILGLIFAAVAGSSSTVGGLFARIILIIPMIQGIGAIQQVKQKKAGMMQPFRS